MLLAFVTVIHLNFSLLSETDSAEGDRKYCAVPISDSDSSARSSNPLGTGEEEEEAESERLFPLRPGPGTKANPSQGKRR